MSRYVEDEAIVVVPLKGENLVLGMPYNCTLTTPQLGPIGIVVFDDDQKEILPIRTLNYNLNHIKETKDKTQTLAIGLDIVLKTIIGISINVGSVSYDSKYNSVLSNEHLQVYYYREDKVERLLPSTPVFDKIKEEFGSKSGSTHLISEVYYGVSFQADVLINTIKSTKLVNKTASGLGSLVIGPISSGIEAALKAVLGNPPDGVTVEITAESTHGDVTGIKTAEDLFDFIKTLDEIPKEEMKPIKMFCVPIGQFLPEEGPAPKMHIINELILQALYDMMATLKDFQLSLDDKGEEVQSTYFSKKVMDGDHRLRIILDDDQNEITIDVSNSEKEWNDKAVDLYKEGETHINRIPEGTTTESGIVQTLDSYRSLFSIRQCFDQIQEYIRLGKEQLSLINADDVDEFTQANFVSSIQGLKAAKAQLGLLRNDAPPFFELQTYQTGDEIIPNGLFLSVYNLSAKMEVIIVMPNESKNFSLTLNPPGQASVTYDDLDEIMILLEILSVVFGVVGGPMGKWYLALASEAGLVFPLSSPNEFTGNVFNFLSYCLKKYKDVKIFPTFMSLKSHIMNPELKDTVMIGLPVSSYVHLTEATQAFVQLKTLVDQSKNPKLKYEFLVGEFDLGSQDAPLVLAFRAGILEAACPDWLDFLRLHSIVEQSLTDGARTPDFTPLSTSRVSTFFPLRTEYQKELYKLFKFSLYQKPSLVHHPDVLHLEKENERIQVETAIEICSAYLAISNREQEMVTKLTLKLLEIEPEYLSRFEGIGWSSVQQGFNDTTVFGEDSRQQIRSFYMDLLFECNSLLTDLGAFVHTLNFCMQSFQAKDKDDKSDHFQYVTDMLNENFLQKFDQLCPAVIQKLTELLTPPPIEFTNASDALEILHVNLMLNPGFITGETDVVEIIPHLQSILSILPIVKHEEPEPPTRKSPEYLRRITSWKESSEDAFHAILTKFVNQIIWDVRQEEIDGWLKKRFILKIVNELGKKRYPIWHQELSDYFRGLTSIKDYEGLIKIVEKKIDGVTIEDLPQQHFIWSNPPYAAMILDAFNDDENFSKYAESVLVAVQRLNEQGDPTIPIYIPTRIARALRQHIYNKENENGELKRRITSRFTKRVRGYRA